MGPAEDSAVRVYPSAQSVVIVRAVHVVLDVLLARPNYLHRTAHPLCDLHRAQRAVVLESAPEPAAEEPVMDAHLLGLEAGEPHHRGLRPAWHLGPQPYFALFLRHMHRAVHWLHGGMG